MMPSWQHRDVILSNSALTTGLFQKIHAALLPRMPATAIDSILVDAPSATSYFIGQSAPATTHDDNG